MPSSNDIIKSSIEQVLNSDDTINLLLISKSLDDINGEVVGSDPDYGMHFNYLFIGMSGQQLVDQMNSNFHAIDAQFLAHNDALNVRIISNQIKEIKEENGVVYYTTDNTADPIAWIPLQAEWGKIVGDINKQQDLQQALSSKTPISDFNDLAAKVSTNSSNILLLQGSVSTLSNTLTALSNQINGADGILVRLTDAEATLAKKITSEEVLEIRVVNGTALEFTTDGEHWNPVSDAGMVEWGNITGDIANQADLQLLLKNINDSLNTISSNLTSHVDDENNPHNVTAEQVGLGNVDNTSDDNKPLGTVQQEAVVNLIDTNVKFKSLTKEEYDALESKDSTTFYFINND